MFRFAFFAGRSVEGATDTLLHQLYSNADKTTHNLSRVLLVSTFNTIQYHILLSKLVKMNVDPTLILWTHSYLKNRPRYVWYHMV